MDKTKEQVHCESCGAPRTSWTEINCAYCHTLFPRDSFPQEQFSAYPATAQYQFASTHAQVAAYTTSHQRYMNCSTMIGRREV